MEDGHGAIEDSHAAVSGLFLAIGYRLLTHVYFAGSWIDCRRHNDSDAPLCDRFSSSTAGSTKFQNEIDPLCRPFERTRGAHLEE